MKTTEISINTTVRVAPRPRATRLLSFALMPNGWTMWLISRVAPIVQPGDGTAGRLDNAHQDQRHGHVFSEIGVLANAFCKSDVVAMQKRDIRLRA